MLPFSANRCAVLAVAVCAFGPQLASAQRVTTYGELPRIAIGSNDTSPQESAAIGKGPWNVGPEGFHFPTIVEILRPAYLQHTDPDDPLRSTGLGKPLATSSWRNRPFHIGWMFGGLLGGQLVPNQIRQDDDMLGGYRLGWDFDHYWGTELRFSFAHLNLIDTVAAQPLLTAQNHYGDVNLLYYPWGDATWRPFASLGVGAARLRFQNSNAQLVDDVLLTIPFGAGVKYYYRPWLALRTSLIDYWTIGSQGLSTMHNVAVTAGVEVHFGGPRRSYFPYHPGGVIW